jgi:hypothetical protein
LHCPNPVRACCPSSDCAHTFISRGYNLIRSTGCRITGVTTGNPIGVDPKLGSLQNNGGPTATRALLAGSPAIDAGSPAQPGSGLQSCEAIDQRDVMRLQDGDADGTRCCDIGAYEHTLTPLMLRRALMPMIRR